jgi:hypothetical protein
LLLDKEEAGQVQLSGVSNYLKQFVVLQELDDVLVCTPFQQPINPAQTAQVPQIYSASLGIGGVAQVYVAKPYLLQKTPWNGRTATFNGVTGLLTYTGLSVRDFAGVTQQVAPSYAIGEVILAVRATSGYLDAQGNPSQWMDSNAAGRVWQSGTNTDEDYLWWCATVMDNYDAFPPLTIENTTTETSFFTRQGIGKPVVPPLDDAFRHFIRISAGGLYSSKSSSPGNVTIQLYQGLDPFCQSFTGGPVGYPMVAGLNASGGVPWSVNIEAGLDPDVGEAGDIEGSGFFRFVNNVNLYGVNNLDQIFAQADSTGDAANPLDMTAQFTVADPDNWIFMEYYTVEILRASL